MHYICPCARKGASGTRLGDNKVITITALLRTSSASVPPLTPEAQISAGFIYRTFSGLGPVQRSRASSMSKNPVEKPGKRFISSSVGLGSIAPPRAPPRSERLNFIASVLRNPKEKKTPDQMLTPCSLVVYLNDVVFGSQEPRHLQYVADLEDLNVYKVVNGRKLYGAPSDFTFSIKVFTSSGPEM